MTVDSEEEREKERGRGTISTSTVYFPNFKIHSSFKKKILYKIYIWWIKKISDGEMSVTILLSDNKLLNDESPYRLHFFDTDRRFSSKRHLEKVGFPRTTKKKKHSEKNHGNVPSVFFERPLKEVWITRV